MALSLFSIKKANARIVELEASLTAMTKERDEAVAAVGGNESETAEAAAELSANLESCQAELAVAKNALASLRAENDQLKAQAGKTDVRIETEASRKALAITAGQGQPPIAATVTATAGGPQDIVAQHAEIKDPAERARFFRENKNAYNAAWRAMSHDQQTKFNKSRFSVPQSH